MKTPRYLAVAGCALGFMACARFAACAEPETMQPCRIIDAQTAGVLPKGHYEIETWAYPSRSPDVDGAGITFGINVGITDRFMFGSGYGADGVVGRGTVRGNPWPGLLLKYRLVEETYFIPGIAAGYDWQGYGGVEGYTDTNGHYRGYVYKSQGFFVALSKNYLVFSKVNIGLHGGANYSMEEYQKVLWPDCYVGTDIGFNEEFAIAAEYDLALNQKDPNSTRYANPMDGYLNAGIHWAIFPSFSVEFNVKDLLNKKVREAAGPDPSLKDIMLGWSRELKFIYLSNF